MEPKTGFSEKWPTCDPTGKCHIQLKVGPLKGSLKSMKEVSKKQVESKSHFRHNFLVVFYDFWCPLGSLGRQLGSFLPPNFEAKFKVQKGGSETQWRGARGDPPQGSSKKLLS